MTRNSIKYPEIRNEVVQSLKWLSGRSIKLSSSSASAHSLWYDLKYPIEDLLEDFESDHNGEESIGYSLYNEREYIAIKKVSNFLDRLLEEIGPRKSDSAYVGWSGWEELVKAAEESLKLLSENNHKYNFIYKDL